MAITKNNTAIIPTSGFEQKFFQNLDQKNYNPELKEKHLTIFDHAQNLLDKDKLEKIERLYSQNLDTDIVLHNLIKEIL